MAVRYPLYPRRSRKDLKFQGLVNVSGFHVDPGFRGRLKFAVYNAGSKDILVDQDERVFMICFADLNAESTDPYPASPQVQSVISSDDISKIKGTVASPAQLQKSIDELKAELENKVHAVEQSSLINRTLMILLLGICGTLLVSAFLKPVFEGTLKPPFDDSVKLLVCPVS